VAYNLLDSYKVADVWFHSNSSLPADDGLWTQVTDNSGDYYAQNTDVVQPGSIPPWYQRYGHSLSAVDINSDGEKDIMILAGGYAPSPTNDLWVTEDGHHWMFVKKKKYYFISQIF
jgi:hypothetical protein